MLPSLSNKDNACWIQRDFLKEKLRVRERYWHPISPGGSKNVIDVNVTQAINCIIPDGMAWRMYLPLITYLVEKEEEFFTISDSSVLDRTKKRQRCCTWVLLESVTDWMDHRSISLTMRTDSSNMPPEMPLPHERAKIQRLIKHHTDAVKIFCDLSIRECVENGSQEDEWDLMQYEIMSVSDRSENALFRAGRFLRHFCTDTKKSLRFFILSADQSFVQRFPEEDNTQTIFMKDLLKIFQRNASEEKYGWLTDKVLEHAKNLLFDCEEDYKERNDRKRHLKDPSSVSITGVEKYWNEDRIKEGLRNNTLFKGTLDVTKENVKEAAVLSRTDNDSLSLFVNQARGYFNRAFHQDHVIVQVLPKEQWTSPIGRRRLIHVRSDDDDNSILNSTRIGISSDTLPPVLSGRVVSIAKKSRRQFVATMTDVPLNDESSCLVVPMDERIPKIRIRTNGWRRFLGQRLWVQVTNWEVGSTYPSGHCVEILGPIADLETEITCLLKENQIELDPFTAAAQACLPVEGHGWQIPSDEISKRKDLRSSRRIFSVDPNGCQDIDDTFHAHLLGNGDVEVGVHIADVTFFLQHDSALDKEARKRATTFYLVDRRFDMLPSLLSSDLCSLHGNVDRLAVSTIWTMSSDFKRIKSFWYGRTVIRNCQAMTYEQAHNIIHSKPPDDPSKPLPPPLTAGYPVSSANIDFLRRDLSLLTRLARKLRKDREDIGGAVDLTSDSGNELKFSLDEDNNPIRVTPKKQLEIHQTVAGMFLESDLYY